MARQMICLLNIDIKDHVYDQILENSGSGAILFHQNNNHYTAEMINDLKLPVMLSSDQLEFSKNLYLGKLKSYLSHPTFSENL